MERYLYEKSIENALVRGTRRVAMEKGMKRGMEKGLEKGMKKGMEKAKQEMAQKMLASGFDRAAILEITGIDLPPEHS